MTRMTPAAARAAILIVELMTFFLVTALMIYLVSHAGAWHPTGDDPPPPAFPVIAFDGDAARPDPKDYLIVPVGEWPAVAGKRPGASLLLPQRAATLRIGESDAIFTATEVKDGRQEVRLTWRGAGAEQQSHYVAQARTLSPRYYRSVTGNTFLLAAVVGFVISMILGRTLRRRWLVQPAYPAPPHP